MTAENPNPPDAKPSNVVPMTVRPAQPPPVERKTASPPGPMGPVESHPADEPGYGHGV